MASRWLLAEGQQPPLVAVGSSREVLDQLVEELVLLNACSAVTESYAGGLACRQCADCGRALRGNSVDVLRLETTKKSIGIATVREVLRQARQKSWAKRRMIVVPRAHRLTAPAANSLLKLLEEPAEQTRIILTTRWPRRLLSTIKSRCQRINWRGLDEPRETVARTGAQVRLSDQKQLTQDDLAFIHEALIVILRRRGTTSPLRRAMMRLRDYHVTCAQQGNEKLARYALFAALDGVRQPGVLAPLPAGLIIGNL